MLYNGDFGNILLMLTADSIEILGVWPGIEDGMAAREIIPVVEGDLITPLFVSYDLNTDQESYISGAQFEVGVTGLELGINDLPSGIYKLGLLAKDYSQNSEMSEFAGILVP